MPKKKDPKLSKIGASAYNKPVKTPNHKTKSHAVVARKSDGTTKLVRFGQAGVQGAGKNPKTDKEKARRKSFLARHNVQNPNPDKFSPLFWAKKTKW